MVDGISFDFSELDRLAGDLESVPKNIGPFLMSAIKFTSVNIKRASRRKVQARHKRFRAAVLAIDFEVKKFSGFGVDIIQSEIGYDKDLVIGGGEWKTPGDLGNLLEFGAPGAPNAMTPGNELSRSLHENEADFIKGVERAEEDARKKAGL